MSMIGKNCSLAWVLLKNEIIMKTKLYTYITILIISIFLPNRTSGENIRKDICNGRTVTERTYTSKHGLRYVYTVDTNITKADSIKKSKLPLSVEVKYPTWSSKQAFDDLQEKAIACFSNIENCASIKNDLLDFMYLIDDTGEIICLDLRTSRSLYDIYTPAEVISIFDEISQFRFPVPVTIWPSESVGWETMSMSF